MDKKDWLDRAREPSYLGGREWATIALVIACVGGALALGLLFVTGRLF